MKIEILLLILVLVTSCTPEMNESISSSSNSGDEEELKMCGNDNNLENCTCQEGLKRIPVFEGFSCYNISTISCDGYIHWLDPTEFSIPFKCEEDCDIGLTNFNTTNTSYKGFCVEVNIVNETNVLFYANAILNNSSHPRMELFRKNGCNITNYSKGYTKQFGTDFNIQLSCPNNDYCGFTIFNNTEFDPGGCPTID